MLRALARRGISAREGGTGPTILVVDDDTCILDMHTRIIQAQLPGCRISKAGNGRAALERLAQEPVDLMVLDLMMPELDGFAVLEAMQSRETTRSIPVIVVTAQILTQADMNRLQQGVVAVLSKGLFTTAEVLSEVESALARSKRLGNERQRVARRAMAYIHEHYAEPLTREDIARQCRPQPTPPEPLFQPGNGAGRHRVSQPLPCQAGQDSSSRPALPASRAWPWPSAFPTATTSAGSFAPRPASPPLLIAERP